MEPHLRTARSNNRHCRIGDALDDIEQWIRHIAQLHGIRVGHQQRPRLDRIVRLGDESEQFALTQAFDPFLRRWGHVAHAVDQELELDPVPGLSCWRRQKFDGVTHAKSTTPQQYLKGRRVKTESESFK